MNILSVAPFSTQDDGHAELADWRIAASPEQLRIHSALVKRSLTPVESELLAAAAWLRRLYDHHQRHPRFEPHAFLHWLDEKSNLLHRLAWRHVPTIAPQLQQPESPLYAIDAAARFLPPESPAHPPALPPLRQTIAQLPPVEVDAADPAWQQNRRQLRAFILQDNPSRFLTWPVVANSMFMSDTRVAAAELTALQSRPDYQSRWLPALREDAMGAPPRTPLHPTMSTNLIHHAYNLLQLELRSHTTIDALPSILEFGGGYGSTARLAFHLGFRGTYAILDLPEFSALQRYYLQSLGLPVGSSIHCVSDLSALPPVAKAPALFLATWSLSETPIDFRERLHPSILAAESILIAYQDAFGTADNKTYFQKLAQRLKGKIIHNLPIPHLPDNYYFIVAPRV